MPVSTISGVLLIAEVQEAQPERVDARTGEKYDARPASGTLCMLDSDNGEPVIVKYKCSTALARKYQQANTFLVGSPLRLTSLVVDTSEYKLDNGRQGITRRVVEDDVETGRRPRGTFKLVAPAPEPSRSQPSGVIQNAQTQNAQAQNGQRLAPAGA